MPRKDYLDRAAVVRKQSGLGGSIWQETPGGRKEMIWRLQGGQVVTAADCGDWIPSSSAAELVKPGAARNLRRWERTFAVLPVLTDRRMARLPWFRVGVMRLLQFQSGLRFDLDVWRRSDTGVMVACAPLATRQYVWMSGGEAAIGAWALPLWKEAYLRVATGMGPPVLDYLSRGCSPRWYHRVWRQPRRPRWAVVGSERGQSDAADGDWMLGPNGFGDEIDSEKRILRSAAARAGKWIGDGDDAVDGARKKDGAGAGGGLGVADGAAEKGGSGVSDANRGARSSEVASGDRADLGVAEADVSRGDDRLDADDGAVRGD